MIPSKYSEAREALIDEMCCRIVESEARILIDETVNLVAKTKKSRNSRILGATMFLFFSLLWLFWPQHETDGMVIFATTFPLVFFVLLREFTSGNKAIIRLEKNLVYLRNIGSGGVFVHRIMRKVSDFACDKTIPAAAEFLGIHLSVEGVITDLARRCAAQMEKNDLHERARQWLSVVNMHHNGAEGDLHEPVYSSR